MGILLSLFGDAFSLATGETVSLTLSFYPIVLALLAAGSLVRVKGWAWIGALAASAATLLCARTGQVDLPLFLAGLLVTSIGLGTLLRDRPVLPIAFSILAGSLLAKGALFALLGFWPTAVLGILLLTLDLYRIPDRLFGRLHPSPSRSKSRPTESLSEIAFVFGILLVICWQHELFFTQSSVGAEVGFKAIVFASILIATGLRSTWALPEVGASQSLLIAAIPCLLALPGILRPDFHSVGATGPGLIAGFLVTLLLIAGPPLILAWQLLGNGLFSFPVALACASGIALSAWVSDLWGSGWCLAAASAVLIAWRPRRRWRFGILTLAACAAFAFFDNNHYWNPPPEVLLQSLRHGGDAFAVTRSSETGDLRLRRNFHQIVESVSGYSQGRRHFLLPLRLHPDASRALLIGGGNSASSSAAMEQHLTEFTLLEPRLPLLELSRWFTSEQASRNTTTRSARIVEGAYRFLKETNHDYDLIVMENRAPWQEGATAYHSVEFLESVKDRLYPDGTAAQWFALYQWTDADFSRVVATWRRVFGDNIRLWRCDLMPDHPMVALVAQPQASRKQRPISLIEENDPFLSDFPALTSLLLADSAGLSQLFERQNPTPFHADKPELEWHAGVTRLNPESLLTGDDLLRFLATLTAEDGAAYGGLLWTKAVLSYRRGDETWKDQLSSAIRQLGFDPKRAYPNAFDSVP